MSTTTKRAAAVAACAVAALTATSTPAYAATATADYTCSVGSSSVAIRTVWTRTSASLTIRFGGSPIAVPVNVPVGGVSTVVNGVPLVNPLPLAVGDPITQLGPASVPGSVFAPNPLVISIATLAGPIPISCSLTAQSGFPI